MTMADQKIYLRLAWVWILAFTLLRMFYSQAFLLTPDEANYWQWGRHLDWGYHDQAPLIGWAIRASTSLFGNTEFGVRLPSVLAMTVASLYMVATAHRWYGVEAAFGTALLTQAIFEFNLGGLLATPDGLQAAAWAGATYHVARGYEENTGWQWMFAGAWFGFGLLAKFTMVIFLPSAYTYGLFARRHRNRLVGIKPYAGVALGLVMFLPVILWNHAHNWNSVRHVAHIGGADEPFGIHLNFLGDYIGSQAALLTPLVFLLVLMAWGRAATRSERQRRWISLYLFCTSFVMFAAFAVLSLHSRVYGNWPGAGYIPAAVLVAAFYFGRKRLGFQKSGFGRKLYPWAVGSAYLITAVILVQVVWPIIPIPKHLDRISHEILGWDTLGIRAGAMKADMPIPDRTFLFATAYQEASQLAFYTPGQPRTVAINKWSRPNVYDYWWQDKDLIHWDGVGVSYGPEDHKGRLAEVFERVDPPVRLPIYRKQVFWRRNTPEPPLKVFYLYRAYGFKGGLRWIPPDADDVRVSQKEMP